MGSMFSSHCFLKRVILIPFLKIIIVAYFLFKFYLCFLLAFFQVLKRLKRRREFHEFLIFIEINTSLMIRVSCKQ